MTQFRQCFITNSNPCLVAQASVHSCGGADKVIKTELPALVGTADVGDCPATLLQQLKQWHLVARLPKQQSENSKSIDLLSTENKVSSAEILRELGYFLLRAQFQR